VWDYYTAVVDHLLPEIIGHPLSLIRCPSGTGKPCFFQKHHTSAWSWWTRFASKKKAASMGTTWWFATPPAC